MVLFRRTVEEPVAITLYQYPGGDGLGSVSPPCLKVDLALHLLDVAFDYVNLRSARAAGKIGPTGRLPVLELDGRRIHDSVRILDELEQRFDAPWLAATQQQRIQDRLWEYLVNEHLYWCGFYLRWIDPQDSRRFFNALFGRMRPPARWYVKLFVVPRQRRRSRYHGSGRRAGTEIRDEFVRVLDMQLSALEGGPFLQGRSSPGRGDLAIAALSSQAGFRDTLPEMCRHISERPPIVDHLRAVFSACRVELPRWLAELPGPAV